MGETVEIDIGDGVVLHAEVLELPVGAMESAAPIPPVSGGDAGFRRTHSGVGLGLDQVRTIVRGIGRWAADTCEGGNAGSPDSFEVEFGLKLAVSSGRLIGVIAQATAEASLLIRMGWDSGAHGEAAEGRPHAEPRPAAQEIPAPQTTPILPEPSTA